MDPLPDKFPSVLPTVQIWRGKRKRKMSGYGKVLKSDLYLFEKE